MSAFVAVERCWICEGTRHERVHDAAFELAIYGEQDPELAAYTGAHVAIVRCATCGFAQPEQVPALERYFDRMYDQRWSADWIETEFEAGYKDLIFDGILDELARRLPAGRRRLLDVGAHAGRFMFAARRAGWTAEGIELNPKTAAFAARASGGTVHQRNIHEFHPGEALFDAITLTDVLEHVPEPLAVLKRSRELLSNGGWIAIKVPNGPAQRFKEHARAMLRRGYRPALADNLVHVNHFSPRALRLALERAGFAAVTIVPGAPELPPGAAPARWTRLGLYRCARIVPGAVHTPLALNLQAFATRRD